MTDVNDLVGYFTGLQLVGLGKCRVGLCRRGVVDAKLIDDTYFMVKLG